MFYPVGMTSNYKIHTIATTLYHNEPFEGFLNYNKANIMVSNYMSIAVIHSDVIIIL